MSETRKLTAKNIIRSKNIFNIIFLNFIEEGGSPTGKKNLAVKTGNFAGAASSVSPGSPKKTKYDSDPAK